jgi:hypothetical protein
MSTMLIAPLRYSLGCSFLGIVALALFIITDAE